MAYGTIASLSVGSRTNSTVSKPASTASGDRLTLIFVVDGVSPTPPAGFSGGLVVDIDPADGAAHTEQIYVWHKTAGGSEGASYQVTHASAFTELVCIRCTGRGDSASDQASTANIGFDNATVTATGATVSANDTDVIFAAASWDDFPAASPPAGTTPTFTEIYDAGAGSNLLYVAIGNLATAQATGNKTVTGPSTNGWGAALVFLGPSGGAATIYNRRIFGAPIFNSRLVS